MDDMPAPQTDAATDSGSDAATEAATDPMPDALVPELDHELPPEGVPIGRASELSGVGIEALRYYEREGLLLDATDRDSGGRRRYHANDLRWIAGLVMLRETGMPIADMRVMAELSRTAGTEADRLVRLEEHRTRVLEALARTRAHLGSLDRKIAAYRAVVDPDRKEAP